MLEVVLLKLHAKLAPGWALIRVKFDPMQEIGPKVGGGRSIVSGPFIARLQYTISACLKLLSAVFPHSISYIPDKGVLVRFHSRTLRENCT